MKVTQTVQRNRATEVVDASATSGKLDAATAEGRKAKLKPEVYGAYRWAFSGALRTCHAAPSMGRSCSFRTASRER